MAGSSLDLNDRCEHELQNSFVTRLVTNAKIVSPSIEIRKRRRPGARRQGQKAGARCVHLQQLLGAKYCYCRKHMSTLAHGYSHLRAFSRVFPDMPLKLSLHGRELHTCTADSLLHSSDRAFQLRNLYQFNLNTSRSIIPLVHFTFCL